MARSNYVFTSESVSEGHPDKVADRISDTVVDAFIAADPEARVACETMVTTNRIILAGEVRAGKPGNDKAAKQSLHQGHHRVAAAEGSRGGERYRLRAKRLPLGEGQVRLLPARPIRAHRPRRRLVREEGRRRRRPRHHVWLRVQRNA